MEDVPYDYCIYDHRLKKDLKSSTLTGYKKNDVVKAMGKAIINSKIEEACRWSIELHVSGMTELIFDELLLIYFKHININNPYYFFYFIRRRKYYYNLISNYPKNILLFTRDNQEIRNLICELVSILVFTKKNSLFENKSLPKIPKYAFEYKYVKQKIISNNTHNIYKYLDTKDTTETKIGLNEIINLLYSKKKTFLRISFWYLWLKKYFKENKNLDIIIRENINNINEIEHKYRNDWIWMLWNIFLDYSHHKNKIIKQYINYLFIEYKNKYKGFNKNNKNLIILYVFYILTNNINFKVNIRQQERYLIQTSCMINNIYKAIEETLIKHLNYEQIKYRCHLHNEIIMKEDVKLKNKKKREEKKILNFKKEQTNKKNLKRLNAFYEFTPYKNKTVNTKDDNKNVKDYFMNNKNSENNIKKIINFEKKNNNTKIIGISKINK